MQAFFHFVLFLLLTACISPSPQHSSAYQAFIANEDSMTTALKQLDPNLSVELLESGEKHGVFVRTVVLKLQQTPVILAVSRAGNDSPIFVKILAEADRTPIGTRLFAKDSGIRRSSMEVKQVSREQIQEESLKSYLRTLNIPTDSFLALRRSLFTQGEEQLELIEYVLPSVETFLEKQSPRS